MPQPKREEAGSLSKYERQNLKRLYRQGGTSYGSLRNFVKASNLPVSKVRQISHSKSSYSKFTLAARKFKRMKSFARFKYEFWCIDLAYVGIFANGKYGVEYLLVRQDLFDGIVDVKGMKTNIPKKRFVHCCL